MLNGPEEVLILDEPDNYLDVPAKRWLEEQIRNSKKTILFISHDRELLAATATKVVTLEQGITGNSAWIHGEGFNTWHDARKARNAQFAELLERWQDEHKRLKELVLTMQWQAASSPDMASRYRAMQTRLRKFEEIGPPPPGATKQPSCSPDLAPSPCSPSSPRRAAAFRADPRVIEAMKASNIPGLNESTLGAGETWRDLAKDSFDVEAAGARGYGYELVDQLALEHLMGVKA